jgi:nucleotide-binding universal stress UspA family protein
MADASRVLVPLGGRSDHSHLRARLIASLSRSRERSLTFLGSLPSNAPRESQRRYERDLRRLARDEAAGPYEVAIDEADRPLEAIIQRAADTDLVILGMQRQRRGYRLLGELPLAVAHETDVPIVLIGRRRSTGIPRPGFLAP